MPKEPHPSPRIQVASAENAPLFSIRMAADLLSARGAVGYFSSREEVEGALTHAASLDPTMNAYRKIPTDYWQAVLDKHHNSPRWQGAGQSLPWRDLVFPIHTQGEYLLALRLCLGVTNKQLQQPTGVVHSNLARAERNQGRYTARGFLELDQFYQHLQLELQMREYDAGNLFYDPQKLENLPQLTGFPFAEAIKKMQPKPQTSRKHYSGQPVDEMGDADLDRRFAKLLASIDAKGEKGR